MLQRNGPAGPGCGRVQGLLLQQVQAVCAGWSALRQAARAQALAVFGRWRWRLPLMCTGAGRRPTPAPAPVAGAEPPCYINEPFVAQHTVPTDCTVTVLQQEIKWPCWQHSSPIFRPKPAFQVNYIIMTCFSSLLPSLLLIRLSLLHSSFLHYYLLLQM